MNNETVNGYPQRIELALREFLQEAGGFVVTGSQRHGRKLMAGNVRVSCILANVTVNRRTFSSQYSFEHHNDKAFNMTGQWLVFYDANGLIQDANGPIQDANARIQYTDGPIQWVDFWPTCTL